MGLPWWFCSPPANVEDTCSIPGLRRSPGGNGNPLQYSCLKNPMDRGGWWTTVHRFMRSQTKLSDWAQGCFACLGPELCCMSLPRLFVKILLGVWGFVNCGWYCRIGMTTSQWELSALCIVQTSLTRKTSGSLPQFTAEVRSLFCGQEKLWKLCRDPSRPRGVHFLTRWFCSVSLHCNKTEPWIQLWLSRSLES